MHAGVSSLGLEGAEKDELVVIGNGVDPVCLAKALRKKFNVAQIIKVEEIKEDKKEGKEDSSPSPSRPPPWSYAPGYYCPPYPQSVVYENPYGSQCIIMNKDEHSRCKVETTCRLAQAHCAPNFDDYYSYRSDPFIMAIWKWKFSVDWIIRTASCVTLSAKIRDKKVPITSFVIRIIDSAKDRKVLAKLEVKDKLLKKGGRFDWRVGSLPARFIIDLEFLDLKASSPNGKDVCSIWPTKIMNHQKPNSGVLESVGRMLTEKIHTDVTINASDGSIGAHRAVLAARSPVFHGMFKHNLKEKDDSTINISDMSIESCQAFINYLYGVIEDEEFFKHRLELLHAADKYDICDLRDVCSESLAEDMDSSNVLERLQDSYLYQLPKLKHHCMQYLVKFGRIFDIKDDFDAFLQTVDKDLVIQLLGEVLNVWKGS
ncbi:hypothetical protein AHAS_Ahas17G0010300 [Arachis hypogaea]